MNRHFVRSSLRTRPILVAVSRTKESQILESFFTMAYFHLWNSTLHFIFHQTFSQFVLSCYVTHDVCWDERQQLQSLIFLPELFASLKSVVSTRRILFVSRILFTPLTELLPLLTHNPPSLPWFDRPFVSRSNVSLNLWPPSEPVQGTEQGIRLSFPYVPYTIKRKGYYKICKI